MADTNRRKTKRPGLAAFLSLVPGGGALYNGNWLKALGQLLVFILLAAMADKGGGAGDKLVFGLLIVGFYIFQIIDSYNEAALRSEPLPAAAARPEKISFFWALVVLCLGIVFQLANLDFFTYRQVVRLWPVLLIVFGIKIIFNCFGEDGRNEAG